MVARLVAEAQSSRSPLFLVPLWPQCAAGQKAGLVLIAATMLLTACGVGTTQQGDPVAGQRLYSGATPIAGGQAPDCIGCHPVEAGDPGDIGPNLSNIGNRAATTIERMSAEDYLRSSILDPDAYLAGGFQEGIHFRDYSTVLSEQQVNDLIAYMLTLKSGQE